MDRALGIPRALLFHEYGDLWTDFFARQNIPAVLSGETTKSTLDRGSALAIDEYCLPLKIYLGHAAALLEKDLTLFVPRMVSYRPGAYFCCKFAGLPDIVRNTFHVPPSRLFSPNLDGTVAWTLPKAVYSACRSLGRPPVRGTADFFALLRQRKAPAPPDTARSVPAVAVLGHSYLLRDDFFCREIIKALNQRGLPVVTAADLQESDCLQAAAALPDAIYWQLSARLAGAAARFTARPDVAAVVLLSSFACGPDSLINEYIEHYILRPGGKPYLTLMLDEHTGSAGVITRLEAFMDVLDWRNVRGESHLASYGIPECRRTQPAARSGD